MFYRNIHLVLRWILSYQESTAATLISLLAIYKTFFLLACNTDSILKHTHSRDFRHKTISGIFVQLSNESPYFCPLKVEVILK